MDNLTHALTGVMLSRAGLQKYVPRASLLLAVAANMPDIDILWILQAEPVLYLEHHRAITHGLAMAPVLALAPVLLFGLIARHGYPWAKAYILSLIGVLSHLLLDWTNIYGVRLLLPFSSRWLRLDTTAVIDVWIWIVLLVAALWPLLAKLVSSEIGAPSGKGTGLARVALTTLLFYDGSRFVLHQRAVALLEARLHAGENPIRVAALPYMMNPLRWTGLVQIRNGYVVHELDLARDFDPTQGKVYYQADLSPAIETARKTRDFGIFLDFSAFPLWQVTRLPEPEGAVRVEANDMRFGLPGEGRFMAYCELDPQGRVQRTGFLYEREHDSIRLR